LGPLPGRGDPDLGEIWALGFVVAAFLLLWLEQRAEEAAATPSNNSFTASCSLELVVLAFLVCTPVGLGGEGGYGRSRGLNGSGGSWSAAPSMRGRGAGEPPVVFSPPSSPLPAGLGGEGIGVVVVKHSGSSIFSKRGLRCRCRPAVALSHLAALGGEGVVLSLLRAARVCDGLLWEPLELGSLRRIFRGGAVRPPRFEATGMATPSSSLRIARAFSSS
jgi:hypothetical protein